jgi:preprotein translocase subunit SecE
VAQQNRRRARKGGSPKPNGRPENGRPVGPDPEFPELESGEEQLTEAQAAFGRPDPAETPNADELTAFEESESGRDYEEPPSAGALSTRAPARRRDRTDVENHQEVARGSRQNPVTQLIGFAKGSVRELQRVQWPDRRQVFQATGVVLGFVIVAGAFLAGASWAAQKIVNLILYGHG